MRNMHSIQCFEDRTFCFTFNFELFETAQAVFDSLGGARTKFFKTKGVRVYLKQDGIFTEVSLDEVDFFIEGRWVRAVHDDVDEYMTLFSINEFTKTVIGKTEHPCQFTYEEIDLMLNP